MRTVALYPFGSHTQRNYEKTRNFREHANRLSSIRTPRKTLKQQKKELRKTYQIMEGVCSVAGLSTSDVVKDNENELISDHMDQWIVFMVKTH
jgi:hypothetical protein